MPRRSRSSLTRSCLVIRRATANSIFLERAIIGERLRLGIGLPLRSMEEQSTLSDGIEESAIAEKYYDDPLINIIKFACNACPEKKIVVTDTCQGCLSHQCTEVCPKDAIHIVNGKSLIDQDKCIKCGRCMEGLPHITPSTNWNARVHPAAAWTPSTPTRTAMRRSIMTSVYRAACAWSTVLSAPSSTRARSSRRSTRSKTAMRSSRPSPRPSSASSDQA